MGLTPPSADVPRGDPVEVVAAIVVESGRALLTRRTAAQMYPNLWELPGGKVEPGETSAAALARELREELGVIAAALGEYDRVRYRNPAGQDIRVRFLFAEIREGRPEPLQVAEVKWAGAEELSSWEFIPHNTPVAARLAEDLAAGRI